MLKPHTACFALALTLACGDAPDPEQDIPDGTSSSAEDSSGAEGDEEPARVDVPDHDAEPAELTPETDDFVSRIHNVVMQTNGDGSAIHVVAIDGNGTAIGVLTTFADQNQAPNLEANFSDGYLDVVIVGDTPIVRATLPPDVVEARSSAMLGILAPDIVDPKGALGCAVRISTAIALCAPLAVGQWWGVLTCSAGVISAFCKCAPVVGIDDGGVCDGLDF